MAVIVRTSGLTPEEFRKLLLFLGPRLPLLVDVSQAAQAVGVARSELDAGVWHPGACVEY